MEHRQKAQCERTQKVTCHCRTLCNNSGAEFVPTSHYVDIVSLDTLVDDLSDRREKASIQPFFCRSESNRLCARDDSDDRWKKVMALPTFVSENAVAYWADDLKVFCCVSDIATSRMSRQFFDRCRLRKLVKLGAVDML